MTVQWVHLDGGQVLAADERSAWIQPPEPGTIGFRGPMAPAYPAEEATTRRLLDGAIAAAERAAPPRRAAPLTAVRWAWHLASQWYCAHHSVALLLGLIDRFESSGRGDLAGFAREKLEEERGHDALPLADLRALGYDAEALTAAIEPLPRVRRAVEHARACVRGRDPIEFLGYVYALERRILRLSEQWLRTVEQGLPGGPRATSGVRAHAQEFDRRHVAAAVAFIAGLPGDERTLVALGCHRTAAILATPRDGEDPSDGELEARLSQFRLAAAAARGDNERQGDRS